MFIGHFAVGFASKRLAPKTSLGWLFAGALFPDLLWPFFLLAGRERVRVAPGDTAFTPLAFIHYPITHSLAADCGWAALAAGIYWAGTRSRAGAWMIGLGVLSHWVLDAVTHRPDLPLYPGSGVVGLGLWNSIAGTVLVEGLMFGAAVWLYLGVTTPRDRVGTWAFGSLVTVTLLIYAATLMGPPPPSPRAVAWTALGVWLFPVWAAWADRHRAVAGSPTA